MEAISKEKALKLVGNLSRASIKSYECANGLSRASADKAQDVQDRAAQALLTALGHPDVTLDEIDSALI